MLHKLKHYFNHKALKDHTYDFLFEPYTGDEVVIFDTETTGLDTKKDKILSIGAVKVKGNKIVSSETFEVFLTTDRNISHESIKIHGIRPCDLKNALEPQEAMKAFLYFIGNRPLVGYYLEFDIKMVNRYLMAWLGIKLPNKAIEVSGIYFDKKIGLIPQSMIDLKFETILKALDVPNMGQHNAVNDAIMTAMVYLVLTH